MQIASGQFDPGLGTEYCTTSKAFERRPSDCVGSSVVNFKMPAESAYWLVAVPLENHDPHIQFSSLATALGVGSSGSAFQSPSSSALCSSIGQVALPPFKTGTLASLIALSEELPKHDTLFTSITNKVVDSLRALLNNDEEQLRQHVLVNEASVGQYVLGNWSWNAGKYRVGERALSDVVDSLVKEMNSIDNVMKQKLNAYNMAKSQLQALQRKKKGNLSVRSLADVVSRSDFADPASEYLETLLVAVPKNNIKDWLSRYERLTQMVVPRSSKEIARDEEFALFNVTLFKKVKEEYLQKCRENKFVVREFIWDDQLVQRHKQELEEAGTSEKELWTELLHLSRTNFSEAYQTLMHLKVVRAFVESVLRYGLPADYFAVAMKPNRKRTKQLLQELSKQYGHFLTERKGLNYGSGRNAGPHVETPGEYAQLLEEEWTPFVLMEAMQIDI
ncbi:ATPase, V1 complex, subunit C [Tilletiaria anomala UBC 951]|uniref:V-type proton ATPase subunit C n=1 Tax=Tilletiaria anomala (strain ATCC 24038 / CBS 436.72 / UBC 951) TaxID=1037660 RepID=A0A066WNR1_TILAU|nr:ATPase, V1 complex, subunit C [Tilletiaria anomala UBC 951]KDN52250.1 ATPase, V1 complex, subunit C [Tilletiaria anomala UBC 951]